MRDSNHLDGGPCRKRRGLKSRGVIPGFVFLRGRRIRLVPYRPRSHESAKVPSVGGDASARTGPLVSPLELLVVAEITEGQLELDSELLAALAHKVERRVPHHRHHLLKRQDRLPLLGDRQRASGGTIHRVRGRETQRPWSLGVVRNRGHDLSREGKPPDGPRRAPRFLSSALPQKAGGGPLGGAGGGHPAQSRHVMRMLPPPSYGSDQDPSSSLGRRALPAFWSSPTAPPGCW